MLLPLWLRDSNIFQDAGGSDGFYVYEIMGNSKGFNKVKNTVKKEIENKGAGNKLSAIFVSHSKEIISAIVIGVLITVFSSLILDYFTADFETENNALPLPIYSQAARFEQPGYRNYFIQANLAQVIANITPVKIQVNIYYQMNGEFPLSETDIDFESFDLVDHEFIDSAYLTEKGGVGVGLSKQFGSEIYVALEPSLSTNGAFIKWKCITNIDKKYLGMPQGRMCEYHK